MDIEIWIQVVIIFIRILILMMDDDRMLFQLFGFIEAILASFITFVIIFPTFSVKSCGVKYFSDFYPSFHDPVDNVCSNEAVYPLWTMIMLYYGLCALGILVFRVPVVYLISRRMDAQKRSNLYYSVYISLWVLPTLLFIHFVFAGIICTYESLFLIFFLRFYISILALLWWVNVRYCGIM